MYVITGATGNTGSVVADRLLEAGQKVRVVGRDPKRLEKFTEQGAESFVADATDAGALTNAFAGAKAVYAMIPPNIGSPDVRAHEESVSDALRSAIKKNGIKYAVVLSSFGAEKPQGTGPVVGVHSLEKKLERIPSLTRISHRPLRVEVNGAPELVFQQVLISHRSQDGECGSEWASEGPPNGRKILFVHPKADFKRDSAWPLA